MRKLFIGIIKLYQKTLSPDHSPTWKWMFPNGYCRFRPSCSDYGVESIKKHGVIKGGLKTFWRILRCNPFSKGGLDLPK